MTNSDAHLKSEIEFKIIECFTDGDVAAKIAVAIATAIAAVAVVVAGRFYSLLLIIIIVQTCMRPLLVEVFIFAICLLLLI